jgi:hypothetical protein
MRGNYTFEGSYADIRLILATNRSEISPIGSDLEVQVGHSQSYLVQYVHKACRAVLVEQASTLVLLS